MELKFNKFKEQYGVSKRWDAYKDGKLYRIKLTLGGELVLFYSDRLDENGLTPISSQELHREKDHSREAVERCKNAANIHAYGQPMEKNAVMQPECGAVHNYNYRTSNYSDMARLPYARES